MFDSIKSPVFIGLFIHTPLQRGDRAPGEQGNRFNGLPAPSKTAEAVLHSYLSPTTPLKRGVNDIFPGIDHI